ncbi:hypothetical protein, partial [Klebsiella pneumoniae]|uniref:hypothetical protein n=1 Tax=Klebsiella pneumoniae TaxID=573 RepID=UPI003B5A126F
DYDPAYSLHTYHEIYVFTLGSIPKTDRMTASISTTHRQDISSRRFTYGGVSAQQYREQNVQLGFRCSLVGYFKKARYRKGLGGVLRKV